MSQWEFTNPTFVIDSINPIFCAKSAWIGHRNFAYDLMQFLQPRVVVELGTHYGASFFAFCQALQNDRINGRCFAVDTWQGDINAGYYGQEVYELVKATLENKFGTVGELIRLTFDDALVKFDSESIDVLHIDGLHTLEAVTHDFHAWLPKLAPGGIILFHDIAVKEPGFGVYRLWDILKLTYPHIEFFHSSGLGVLFPKGLTKLTQELIQRKDEIEKTYTGMESSAQNTDLKTIAFIICSNNEEHFTIASTHIASLTLPDGFQVQMIRIVGAASMTGGYNYAMKSTSAKYKVYLHQDTYIINPNFILDLIKLFNSNANLGLIGLCGAEYVPVNGIWWESTKTVGKVIEHRGIYRHLEFAEVESDFTHVDAVDGFLMATQYDLPWREDIFDGWHFYDTSQCLEFKKAGFSVGVSKQVNPWCVHYMGANHPFDVNNYVKYQRVFLENYSRVIGPKDTVPTLVNV